MSAMDNEGMSSPKSVQRATAPTIHDVAAAAGVSPMTVSRVLRGGKNVRPEKTLAVLGQVVAWFFVNHGSARLAPTTTAGLLLIQPVLALGPAAVILSERPGGLQLLGAVVVLVSVAIANGALAGFSTHGDDA